MNKKITILLAITALACLTACKTDVTVENGQVTGVTDSGFIADLSEL